MFDKIVGKEAKKKIVKSTAKLNLVLFGKVA